MLACAISALWQGKGAQALNALLLSGQEALEMGIQIIGAMMVWSGLSAMLEESGDTRALGRMLKRLLAPIFPGIEDEACWDAIGMNLSANMLGLGNAATPAGIRACKLLEEQGKKGREAVAMLLAINCSSVQLLPSASMLALRAKAGAAAPADVWLPTLLSSGIATLGAVLGMRMMQKMDRRRGK